jgi:hypothetical protein
MNSKILGRAWQKDTCSGKGTRRRLSLSAHRGQEGHIREVLQEDGCSSTYKSWLRKFLPNSVCSIDCPVWLYDIGLIHALITVYFRRLKINHDSHGFRNWRSSIRQCSLQLELAEYFLYWSHVEPLVPVATVSDFFVSMYACSFFAKGQKQSCDQGHATAGRGSK